MALARSPRCMDSGALTEGPLLCRVSTKLVENYKHTQGHSGAEPASHRAHLIQPETRQLPPSVCLRVRLQLFHYLFEQIGLRLVCGGLIVTRDERLQRAGCRGPGLLSHSAVSSARLISSPVSVLGDSSTFPGQRSVAVLTYATCSAEFRRTVWWGKSVGCFAKKTPYIRATDDEHLPLRDPSRRGSKHPRLVRKTVTAFNLDQNEFCIHLMRESSDTAEVSNRLPI